MSQHDEFVDVSFDELDVRTRQAEITAITSQIPDVYTFHLKLQESMKYYPGQYVLIDYEIDSKPITRAYTMVSSSLSTTEIDLNIQRTEDPVTSHIITGKQVGDVLEIKGPYGKFVWTEQIYASSLTFIAVNIGINAFIAMLRYIKAKKLTTHVLLLYHWSVAGDVLFLAELERLSEVIDLSVLVVDDINNFEDLPRYLNSDLLYICGEKTITNPLLETLTALEIHPTKVEQWF